MDDLTRRFAHHPPSSEEVVLKHEEVRRDIFALADSLGEYFAPEAGREKALFLTKLEEAMMWAHAGIARWQ